MELIIGKLYKTPWKINHGGYVHVHSNLETPLSLEDGEIVMLLGIEEKYIQNIADMILILRELSRTTV